MESLLPIQDDAEFRLGLLSPPPPALARQPEIDHTAPDPMYDTYQRILPMGTWRHIEFAFFCLLF